MCGSHPTTPEAPMTRPLGPRQAKLVRVALALMVLFGVAVGCTAALPAGDTVYITKSGKKYHAAGCSYLKKSSIEISREDAEKKGYTPCSRCNP